jgi:dCTP deaminase
MILNDKQIKKLVKEEDMINPFIDESVAQGISHGLNSFGFDLRCGDEFKIFTNIKGATADPKKLY